MVKNLRLVFAISIANIISYHSFSQSVSVNTTGAPAVSSSILDVSSTDKGVLVPRMSKVQKNAIAAPATGLLVFQDTPDSVGFHYYTGTKWAWIDTAAGKIGWLTTGNAGTNIGSHFIGTTDNIPLSFRQNDIWLGRWNSTTLNYFIGDSAGTKITSGLNNVGIGSKALFNNTTAYANVAIGNSAFQNNTTNLRNTIVGDSAMFTLSYNPGGTYFGDNIAIGSKALFNQQPTAAGNGGKNTVIGSEAGYLTTTGFENTALGVSALRENTTGAANTAVGRSAHRQSGVGNYNSYFGYISGFSDSAGSQNTGLGAYALASRKGVGNNNVAVGFASAYLDSTSFQNTAVGAYSMFYHKSGNNNVAVGYLSSYLDSISTGNTSLGVAAMQNHKSGNHNVAVGLEALQFDSSGTTNTAVGYRALRGNKSGEQNTAIGVGAMEANTRGSFNVAVGRSASFNNDTASNTTAIGYHAMPYNKQDYNTAIGAWAGYNNNISVTNINQGIENTVIGYGALTGNSYGSKNVAIGHMANSIFTPNTFYSNGAPSRNVAVGDSALSENRGDDNVGIGFKALSSIAATNQGRHVAVGSRSMTNSVATYPNTAVGYSSQDSAVSAYANTSMGSFSLTKNKAGFNNTAIGNAAMYEAENITTPLNFNNNTAVGNDALRLARNFGHVAIGSGALRNDTTGAYNTAVGYLSLNQNASGTGNVGLGTFSLRENTVSTYNTAVGYNSLYSHNRNGSNYNTAVGSFAMEQDSSGFHNTGVGTSAFRQNVTGFYNTGVGLNSGYYQKKSYNTFVGAYAGVGERAPGNNYAVDTGQFNTGLGSFALQRIANGNTNTALGYGALQNDSSGVSNVGVGANSLNTIVTGSNNTGIGYNSDVSSASLSNATAVGAFSYAAQDNSMVLGAISGINSSLSTTSVGIGTNTPAARLHIRRNGTSGGFTFATAALTIEDNTSSYIYLTHPSGSLSGIYSGTNLASIRSGIVFNTDSSILLRAGGSSTKMVIDNNGNVGVGANTPLTKFHVHESVGVNVDLRISSASTGFEPGLELVKNGAGTDWKIRTGVSNTLIYSRATNDFVSAPVDEYEMSTTSFRPFTDGGNTLGTSLNRWATVYSTVGAINTSDVRDKENIAELNYGLKEIMKLRPVSFNWKANPQWGRKIGFIAQEVQPVIGEVVQIGELKTLNKAKDDIANPESDKLGIYYSDIIPVAVKAIQEQQVLLEKLIKENDELKKEIKLIKQKTGIEN